MPANDKDTIYIDIDDEITTIIDKLKGSDSKVVALVLPKRAAVFQSIVNMKLLKRAADSSKKNLVLITAEAGLLPLAGASGIHVAKTLTSKPEIPLGPAAALDDDDAIDEDTAEPVIPPEEAAAMPVGQLAGAAAVGAATKPVADDMETLELEDDDGPEDPMLTNKKDFTPPPTKKDKKLHVPNFERFRLLLILGAAVLVLIIGGFIFANYNLAKATINIGTDASAVDANADINLSTTAKTFSPDGNVIPAKLQQQQKTYTQQVATTGQTNNGQKASGAVTLTAKECSTSSPNDVPAGTGISSNGQTYITQDDTSFSSLGKNDHGCFSYGALSDTKIVAQSGGASYNNATSFSVAGRSDVSVDVAQKITGGTDSIIQTVNQNDINSAKSKIAATDLKQSLANQLEGSGYFAIPATYVAGAPTVTQSAQVGAQANTVTVTEVITYTMFGVKQADLKTVVEGAVKGQIDTSKQSLLDYGLDAAGFNINNITATDAQISMTAKATVGPDLNVDTIKKNAAGQRIGAIKSDLSNNPDVTSVDVKLSPFWVTTVPKKADRITVNIAKPKTTASNSNASQP
jgi:hypothetical protein